MQTAAGAMEAGMDKKSIHAFKDSDEAGLFLSDFILEGDIILVKGSRGMKMENVLKYIEAGR